MFPATPSKCPPFETQRGPAAWAHRLGRPLVLAHRGASEAMPENSLAALKRAVEEGADGVEFDVQRCASGELVVFHDHTLGRCLGVNGLLSETPLSRLRSLSLDVLDRRAGRAASKQQVPTLAEWLSAAPGDFLLNLEVKVEIAVDAELGAACARAISEAGRLETTVISSFHPAALVHAGRVEQFPSLGALVDTQGGWRLRLAAAQVAGPVAVHPHHSLVTPRRVRFWHSVGKAVLPWTVDNPEVARRCFEAGVDAIITNKPALMRPLCERFSR